MSRNKIFLIPRCFVVVSSQGHGFFDRNDDGVALCNMVEEGARTSGENQRILYV